MLVMALAGRDTVQAEPATLRAAWGIGTQQEQDWATASAVARKNQEISKVLNTVDGAGSQMVVQEPRALTAPSLQGNNGGEVAFPVPSAAPPLSK